MLDGASILMAAVILCAALVLVLSKSYAADWTAAVSEFDQVAPERLTRAVWILSSVLFLGISVLKFCQYRSFQAHTDLAIFTNVCWNTAHGRWFKDSIKGLSNYMGDHFSPVLIFFAPLLLVWKNGLILQFAQTLLLCLTFPGLYYLARTFTASQWQAALAPLLLTVNPYFHRTASAYFEPTTLAVPAFVWALVFWRWNRKILSGILTLSVLTLKEEAPLALIGVGIYLLVKEKRKSTRIWGAFLIVFSVITFLAVTQGVIPYYLPMTVKSRHFHLFGQFGASYQEIAMTILKHPFRFLVAIVWPPQKWLAPGRLLLSVGLLPLAAPLSLVPVLVMLIPHQMSGYGFFGYQVLSVHYAAFPLGLMLCSACIGLKPASSWIRQNTKAVLLTISGVLTMGLLVPCPYLSPVPLSQEMIDAANEIIAQVPPEVSVWAPTYFVAHMACREKIKTLTDREYLHRDWFDPDVIIMDYNHALPESAQKDILRAMKRGTYVKKAEKDKVILWERKR